MQWLVNFQVACCVSMMSLFLGASMTSAASFVVQKLDYSDSLDSLANPECGFYDARVLRLMPDGKMWDGSERWSSWGHLFQIRVDISRFSENGCFELNSRCETARNSNAMVADSCRRVAESTECKNRPLTAEALALLEEYFQEAREANRSLIVRLAYDGWYDGHSNAEPPQELILEHLRQVGPLYSKYSDVIVYVELGLYGRWGEMNGSDMGSNEVIAEAMQTLLENTSAEIKTGPRRPDIVAAWVGLQTRNDKGWTSFSDFVAGSSAANAAVKLKADTIYRVGMYNDGYLGNSGDMGTVGYGDPGRMTREMMTRWLETYGAHTPYGGELVYNSNESRGAINSPRYLSYEGFRTHTSYLNRFHHKATIDAWADSTFDGACDSEYVGKNGFVYVRNHLGYRYILRKSELPDSVGVGDVLVAKLDIENVGFGNMTQERKVSLILKSGATVREILPTESFDPRSLLSRKVSLKADASVASSEPLADSIINALNGSVAITKYAAYASGRHSVIVKAVLPRDLPPGEWNAFLRISKDADFSVASNFQTVRFGNVAAQFDSTTGSNFIGSFILSDKVTGIRQKHDATCGHRATEIFDVNGRLVRQAKWRPLYLRKD